MNLYKWDEDMIGHNGISLIVAASNLEQARGIAMNTIKIFDAYPDSYNYDSLCGCIEKIKPTVTINPVARCLVIQSDGNIQIDSYPFEFEGE